MAGIAGIINKHATLGKGRLQQAFSSMMQKMRFSEDQLSTSFESDAACFGNAVPVSCKKNDRYQQNDNLGVYAVIEGLVFVDKQERNKLAERYDVQRDQSDYSLIPFLYRLYAQDFVRHITGWFNIFIYDEKNCLALLVNDRLGFLPLYYCESSSFFIFASKIEAILSTGLMPAIKPDVTTIAEHLVFNYPVSDHTYIENIYTLSNAEIFRISKGNVAREKYWSIGELYDYVPVSKEESFHLTNEGLQYALNKILTRSKHKVNFTLTGGWDSRVVLSYLLPEHKDKLNTYSFGAQNSSDITIPQMIAKQEKLAYTPYILDQNYLDNDFLANALRTIELSGGTRNYKRAHYLYAVQRVAEVSDLLITGIYGDQVFKVAGPKGGAVLSQNMIDLLESDFNLDKAITSISNSFVVDCLNVDNSELLASLEDRLKSLKDKMEHFESISQKYYSFRFEYNLRKYFGHEAASYNDFADCFSPFTDYDFLKRFAQTKYFGIHYPFGSNSMSLKKQSTRLYHDFVQANYKPLTEYDSARGYSMKDALTLRGNLKILFKKYFKNKKEVDGFNTNSTDDIFYSFLKSQAIKPALFSSLNEDVAPRIKPDYFSLFYWGETVAKEHSS